MTNSKNSDHSKYYRIKYENRYQAEFGYSIFVSKIMKQTIWKVQQRPFHKIHEINSTDAIYIASKDDRPKWSKEQQFIEMLNIDDCPDSILLPTGRQLTRITAKTNLYGTTVFSGLIDAL